NLRDAPAEVMLRNLPKGDAQLFLLDEEAFEQAARDLSFSGRTRPFAGTTLTLPPFAVARLDIGG
ncbi:MAG TPA: hypothetical protein VGA77_08775, partial [Propylenella sp.]